jgi:hypothetical protein
MSRMCSPEGDVSRIVIAMCNECVRTGGTHTSITHGLVAVCAYERHHTKPVRQELVRKDGRVRLELDNLNGCSLCTISISTRTSIRSNALTNSGNVRHDHAPKRVGKPEDIMLSTAASVRMVGKLPHARSTFSSTKLTRSLSKFRMRTVGSCSPFCIAEECTKDSSREYSRLAQGTVRQRTRLEQNKTAEAMARWWSAAEPARASPEPRLSDFDHCLCALCQLQLLSTVFFSPPRTMSKRTSNGKGKEPAQQTLDVEDDEGRQERIGTPTCSPRLRSLVIIFQAPFSKG